MKAQDDKKVQAHLKKVGLPTWKQLGDEYDVGFAESVKRKVEFLERYTKSMTMLSATIHSEGIVTNAIADLVDLQSKLFELEEKIRKEDGNPLEDQSYMKARELLDKKLQFIHKYKLDVAEFQSKRESRTAKDDDTMFDVEAEVVA